MQGVLAACSLQHIVQGFWYTSGWFWSSHQPNIFAFEIKNNIFNSTCESLLFLDARAKVFIDIFFRLFSHTHYTNNMWLWYLYISSASRTDFWPDLLRALRRMASPEQRNGFWMRKHVCQQVNVLESRFVISGQFHPTHSTPAPDNGKKSAI